MRKSSWGGGGGEEGGAALHSLCTPSFINHPRSGWGMQAGTASSFYYLCM